MQMKCVHDTPLSYKVIILGDANVGKTSFIKQYIDHEFVEILRPTCNVDFVQKNCQVDQFQVKLHIFDTAGQEKFRSLTRSYFKGTDAVLFMYDMSNKDSFIHLSDWVEFYEREADTKNQIRVLVGTKKDKLYSLIKSTQHNEINIQKSKKQSVQVVQKDEIKLFVEKYKFLFKFETSAKQNSNVDAVFDELTRNLIYNSLQLKKNNPIREQEWSIILKRDKQHLLNEYEKNNGCC